MRVTNSMMTSKLMENLNNNRERLDKFNRQLSTGKKFSRPSQDPIGVARSMDLNNTIEKNEQYTKNVDEAIAWTEATDSAYKQAGNVLQRARELAARGANGSLSKQDRQAVADEISELRKSLVGVANTTYNDRYIFGGNKTKVEPYNDSPSSISVSDPVNDPNASLNYNGDINIKVDGTLINNPGPSVSVNNSDSLNDIATNINGLTGVSASVGSDNTLEVTADNGKKISVEDNSGDNVVQKLGIKNKKYTYEGDGSKIKREISPGVEMQINQSGSYFEDPLATLDKLANDLSNDNGKAISQQRINELDQNIDKLLRKRSENGAKQKRLETTKSRLESDEIKFKKLLSKNEDVDIAKTIMNLKTSENVYKAALSSGSRIIQPSLVKFLR
ncbi:hypothetical protein JCM16358_19160 [Halanaerocella petrolearia]